MRSSIERVVNEYSRLRKEAFRLKKAIRDTPELRSEFETFFDQEPKSSELNVPSGRNKSDLIVATILDEFSNESWSPEFCNIMLSLSDWEREIDYFQPDLLFVESAWLGNFSEWSFALEAPRRHSNARQLDRLLDVCRSRGIPTLFWNKEDPLHFDKFIDAAQLFDVVFTTDLDAVPRYKERLGHKRIFALPFAAQPFLCNPVGREAIRDERAFFAGSYYASDHGSRTNQMDMLFDALMKHGGVIYNRAFHSHSPELQMPEKYQSICEPPVPFDEIVDVYKRHSCALNVNSVTKSSTMMSRRVFEVLACATPVISARSDAIENLLDGVVDLADSAEEAEQAIAACVKDADTAARKGHQGYRHVLRQHTYAHRLAEIANAVDSSVPGATFSKLVRRPSNEAKVSVILDCSNYEKAKGTLFSIAGQTHRDFELIVLMGPGLGSRDETRVRQTVPNVPISFRAQETSDPRSFKPVLSQASGELIVLLRETELYGPEMLADLLLPLLYTEASIIGKASNFSYCEKEDSTRLTAPKLAHQYVDKLQQGPLLLTQEAIPLAKESYPFADHASDFFDHAARLGLRTYSCDPYNMISRNAHVHSDDRMIGEGLPLALINI